jgi:hypothetical protein
LRKSFLKAATKAPQGSGLRISTHPLCITPEVLEELLSFGVGVVELGITSLDDKVLQTCHRGYDGRTALERLEMIRQTGVLLDRARQLGFEILRIGLHETASLRETVLAGPAHPALGELARAEALAISLARNTPYGPWTVHRRQRSLLSGHGEYGLRALSRITGVPIENIKENILWMI